MRLVFTLATALLVSAATAGAALAQQTAECSRLQQAIASSGRGNGPSAQYEAAAQKQRGEIDRTKNLDLRIIGVRRRSNNRQFPTRAQSASEPLAGQAEG